MLTSLRARILLAALAVIVAALILNGAISYFTVRSHNDDQIARNLQAVAEGNAQAIEEWVDARSGMLEALDAAAVADDPLPALEQLRVSGDFMNTYLADTVGGFTLSQHGATAALPDARARRGEPA